MENQKNSIHDTCMLLGIGVHQKFIIKGIKDNPYHFTEDALADVHDTECSHLIGCLISGELEIMPQPEYTGLSTVTVKMIEKLKAEHINISDENGEYRKRLYSFRPESGGARIWRVTIEKEGHEEKCTAYKALKDAVTAYNRIHVWKIAYEERKNTYLRELSHAEANMEKICMMLGIGMYQKFKIKGAKHNPYYFKKNKLMGTDGKNHKNLVKRLAIEMLEITPLPEYAYTETVDLETLKRTEIVHVLASDKNKKFRKRLYAVMTVDGLEHCYRVSAKENIRGQSEKKQMVFKTISDAVFAYNTLSIKNFFTWGTEQGSTKENAEKLHSDPRASCSVKNLES